MTALPAEPFREAAVYPEALQMVEF